MPPHTQNSHTSTCIRLSFGVHEGSFKFPGRHMGRNAGCSPHYSSEHDGM